MVVGAAERLHAGLNEMELSLSPPMVEALLDYLSLLIRWNKTYNLTAVRDPLEMVNRHLLESLALQPLIKGEHLLDMGTGAGLPGIPLAIATPNLNATLVDSVGKKVRFLNHVVRTLGMGDRVQPIHGRLEAIELSSPATTVCARALAPLALIAEWADPHLSSDGSILAAKGPSYREELAAIGTRFEVQDVVTLTVPGLPEGRHVVIMRRSATDS